jgi:hypothetical protein
MNTLDKQIADKQAQLEALKAARPKGFCSSKLSSAEDVARETTIEDLEEEIRSLEQKRGQRR